MVDSSQVKEIMFKLGADLCGIGDVGRFSQAPPHYHPTDVMPQCRSVIAFACRFPVGTLLCDTPVVYTRVRNSIAPKIDKIALDFCVEMEKRHVLCVPIPSIECQWDKYTGRLRSIISLKHAAQAAGLGTIGRHSLLITPEYGSMVWLGAVLCAQELEADPLKEPVCNNCGRCVTACPVNALKEPQVNQQACKNYAFGTDEELQIWRISCHQCRDACPYNLGLLNAMENFQI